MVYSHLGNNQLYPAGVYLVFKLVYSVSSHLNNHQYLVKDYLEDYLARGKINRLLQLVYSVSSHLNNNQYLVEDYLVRGKINRLLQLVYSVSSHFNNNQYLVEDYLAQGKINRLLRLVYSVSRLKFLGYLNKDKEMLKQEETQLVIIYVIPLEVFLDANQSNAR